MPRTLSLYQQAHWKNPSLSFRLLLRPRLSIEETEGGGWSSFNSKNSQMFDLNSITFFFYLCWSLHYVKTELGHLNGSLKLHLPSSKCSGPQSVSIRFVISNSSKKISTYKREINNKQMTGDSFHLGFFIWSLHEEILSSFQGRKRALPECSVTFFSHLVAQAFLQHWVICCF